MKKNVAVWLGVVILVAPLLAQCGPTPAATAVTVDRPLVIAILADPENIDPQQYESSNAYYVITEIYEAMLRHEPGGSALQPVLAEKWDISDDGLHYTFHLRKGVKFHDGTPFNADAVKFNVDRQSNPDSPYNKMGTFFYWTGYMSPVESVEVVDEYTVRYNLSQPYAYFLDYLCGGAGMMVSPAAVQKYGEDFVQNPVGTGPYKFVKWDKGQQVVLVRNDDYWGTKAYIKDVIFRPIAEESTKLTAMLTGEVHLAPELGPVMAEQLTKDAGHSVFMAPTGSIWFMGMNVKAEPFTDVRVRQAIAHAINKQTIVHDILKDTVDIAEGPTAPSYPCYNPDITVYNYDPAKAKQLLAEAGYANGFEVLFDVPQSGSGMQLPVEMATAIQADLAAVGITAKIEITDFNTWMDRIRTPEVRLSEMSWNVPPTIEDDILSYVFSAKGLPPDGFNTSWYDNPEVTQLLEEAATKADLQARCELIRRAQKLITDDCPAVFVDHAKLLYGLDSRLKGFNPGLDQILYVETMRWTK